MLTFAMHRCSGAFAWPPCINGHTQRLAKPLQNQSCHQGFTCSSSLCGVRWLQVNGDHSDFFRLLVEIMRVEVHLALRDALSPDERILLKPARLSSGPTGSVGPKPQGAAAQGQAQEGIFSHEASSSSEAGTRKAGEAVKGGGTHPFLEHNGAGIGRPPTAREVDAMPDPIPSLAGDEFQTAGERAGRVLPALLLLAELCLEALAEDSADAEAVADDDVDKPMTGMDDRAEGVTGVAQCTSHNDTDIRQLPALGPNEATRVMTSLTEIFESMLQFLEAIIEQTPQRLNEDPLLLAVVRSLGRCALLRP